MANYFVPRDHNRKPQGLNPTMPLHTPAQLAMGATKKTPQEAAQQYLLFEEHARLERLICLMRQSSRQSLSKKMQAVYDMFIPTHAVGVPNKYVRTELVMSQIGTAISGNPHLDETIYNDVMQCRLSVAGILEYYVQGAEISIRGKETTDRIYDIVQTYLAAWAGGYYDEAENANAMEIVGVPSTNELKAPLPDLRYAEEFAAGLFPKTTRGLFGVRTDTLKLLQSRLTPTLVKPVPQTATPVTRKSFSDSISKRLLDESRATPDRNKRK